TPIVNPTLKLAQYQWPVQSIRAIRWPKSQENVILAIFRKLDDRLGRMHINAVTARLLELLQENADASGQDCLKHLAAEIQHPEPAKLAEQGSELLNSLRQNELVLGAELPGQARGTKHPVASETNKKRNPI
ncbi:MAG: hypothetical protein LC637_05955, partial [Xanthomonadaceae bacterium]|nr:hypothetical protein [Xanthomonadaceae bacterium]